MRIVIYGSRPDGHAKVLAALLGDLPDFEVVGLLDDMPGNIDRCVRGLHVIGGQELLPELASREIEGLMIGFGSATARQAAVLGCRAAGVALPVLVHESAHVSNSAALADGCQVLAGCYVGPDATIGAGVLVNTGAIIEHDVRLGEGSVVGPGAVLTGRVEVGAEAEIGAAVTILPDIGVGARARVGAGAVVTKDVAPGVTVAGVPAHPM